MTFGLVLMSFVRFRGRPQDLPLTFNFLNMSNCVQYGEPNNELQYLITDPRGWEFVT